MPKQFLLLTLSLLSLLTLSARLPAAYAADDIKDRKLVTVQLDADATPAAGSAASAEPTDSSTQLEPWQRWAHLSQDDRVATPLPLALSPAGTVVGQASRFPHGESALLTNASGDPVTLRIGARLDTGLWRVEAALAGPTTTTATATVTDGSNPPPPAPPGVRAWRMESIFQPQSGIVYKTVPLRPGETLVIRWTETVAEADAACRTARHSAAAQGGPKTYTGVTIARALDQAADLVGQIEVLTARGKRDDVVRRAQNALLLVAQAQAMAKNRDSSAAGDDSDTALNRLTGALSEVSCAACDLIPSEVAETDATGAITGVRVSVTNGGFRTIPSVSLALPQPGDGMGLDAPGSERTVFRGLAPGATVTAHFLVHSDDSVADDSAKITPRGVLQFIVDMGAAIVPTGPVP